MLEEERGNGREYANMVLLLGFVHVVFRPCELRMLLTPAEAPITTFIVVLQLRWSQVFILYKLSLSRRESAEML